MREVRIALAVTLGALALWLVGCTTPVTARAVGFKAAFNQVESSGLQQPHAGLGALSVLRRFGLEERWGSDRPGALQALHEVATEGDRPEVLFALAQLSYAWAEDLRGTPGRWQLARDHYLRSAIYAWLYLFPADAGAAPSPFDVRFRDALGLYSRALAQAFTRTAEPGAELVLAEPTVPVFGRVRSLPVATEHLTIPLAEAAAFYPAQAFVIDGLAVRNQLPGLGAPLIGRLREERGGLVRAVGASLLLRVEGSLAELAACGGHLRLELRSPDSGPEIAIGGRRVPVAHDLSAPMAYALSDERVWELATRQFFRERAEIPPGIYGDGLPRKGRIPVVLVHGTVSSPVVWAPAMNTLRADPVIRENFEFWLFIYRSGYPINYSAVTLREALRTRLAELRAAGHGPELDEIVIVGHSQGGLLAKLMAVEPGLTLWDAVFNGPYDPRQHSPERQRRLERGFFFTPVREVKRVVFLATPHRGSELAEWWPARIVRRLLKTPQEVMRATADVVNASAFDRSRLPEAGGLVPTSVEDMSPRNPWLLALAELPLAPGVRAHSIIGWQGRHEPPEGGDGVVPYRSAHLPCVESEKIVRSNHSVQLNPVAIEELRRILRQHLVEAGRLPAEGRAVRQERQTPDNGGQSPPAAPRVAPSP